jgi:molybdopterin synthase sulfur carrier subunit
MARVWIPSLLRDVTGGAEAVTVPGASVGQVIDELDRLHPGARARLCDGGALRSGLAVVVDNEVARLGLLQPVGPDSEVHFLPAIGGGGTDEETPPPVEDHRSPAWVLALVGLIHAELWVAAGLTIFFLVPHLQSIEEAFDIKLPYTADVLAQLSQGFVNYPALFGVLPLLDAAALFVLHRVFASRALRVAWSPVIVGIILLLLLWSGVAQGMMLLKLREAFRGPVPRVVPVPGGRVQ